MFRANQNNYINQLECSSLLQEDPQLEKHRRELVVAAARMLDKARMIRFAESTGTLHSTDLGRTSSHFYIKHVSIEVSMACSVG